MINKLKHELNLVYNNSDSQIDQVISIILPFNERPFTAPPPLKNGIYWRSPREGVRLLALQSGWQRELRGRERFTEAREQFLQLTNSWAVFDPEETGASPRTLFHYAFHEDDPMQNEWHGFPNTLLMLPRVQLINQSGRQSVIFSHQREGIAEEEILENWQEDINQLREILDNHPPPGAPSTITPDNSLDSADQIFRDAIETIYSNTIEKLVIGEQQRFHFSNPIGTERTLKKLERSSPSTAQFSFSIEGRHFIAAPPERLFSKRGADVESDALAGTLPRGSSEEEESMQEQLLLKNPKLRHEHQLVVDAVGSALLPLCETVDIPATPTIHKLENIQHLLTAIKGRLKTEDGRDSTSIFELIEALHQSPAICGTPRTAALQWLTEHNNSYRGGYCGGAGWIDPDGDGEIHVLLRCAMVEDEKAILYAGAGIVKGSVAEDEIAEIGLKIQGMLNALSA
ncbi:MAG: isochorismate synthase [Gammaproteobacteria bacterium]|uniref:isochorismate synthase n=1 Tax=Candidatus Thiopontia autotrophica TaxID=2841688 RepID=A0A8J6PA41_9GAMM|nr:isochorismate synthase [Candidatus Thiopontia autotrophica]MBL6969016.1 isochorismate synthase [Gammaproteobacteria bacterium]